MVILSFLTLVHSFTNKCIEQVLEIRFFRLRVFSRPLFIRTRVKVQPKPQFADPSLRLYWVSFVRESWWLSLLFINPCYPLHRIVVFPLIKVHRDLIRSQLSGFASLPLKFVKVNRGGPGCGAVTSLGKNVVLIDEWEVILSCGVMVQSFNLTSIWIIIGSRSILP